jgi:hypothetical protein
MLARHARKNDLRTERLWAFVEAVYAMNGEDMEGIARDDEGVIDVECRPVLMCSSERC